MRNTSANKAFQGVHATFLGIGGTGNWDFHEEETNPSYSTLVLDK